MISLTWEKDLVLLLCKHGREFVINDRKIGPNRLVYRYLRSLRWTAEGVAPLLRMYPQDLNGCLHIALRGSEREQSEGLTKVLILLIEFGADIYARNIQGKSYSERGCDKRTTWLEGSKDGYFRFPGTSFNYLLRLKEIWAEALSTCGYNAEEVIASSLRLEELSDREIDSIQDQDEDNNSTTDGVYCLALEEEDLNDTPRPNCAAFDHIDAAESNIASWLSGSTFKSHSDWPVQEENQSDCSACEDFDDTSRLNCAAFDLTGEGDSNNSSQIPGSTAYNHSDWPMLGKNQPNSSAVEDINDTPRLEGAAFDVTGHGESNTSSQLSNSASCSQYGWGMPVQEEPNFPAFGDLNDTSRLNSTAIEYAGQADSNNTSQPPGSTSYNHYDWSMLEADINVWRD